MSTRDDIYTIVSALKDPTRVKKDLRGHDIDFTEEEGLASNDIKNWVIIYFKKGNPETVSKILSGLFKCTPFVKRKRDRSKKRKYIYSLTAIGNKNDIETITSTYYEKIKHFTKRKFSGVNYIEFFTLELQNYMIEQNMKKIHIHQIIEKFSNLKARTVRSYLRLMLIKYGPEGTGIMKKEWDWYSFISPKVSNLDIKRDAPTQMNLPFKVKEEESKSTIFKVDSLEMISIEKMEKGGYQITIKY